LVALSFLFMRRPPPVSPLFPYTTLFRSDGTHLAALQHWVLDPPEEVVDRLLEELIVHPQGVVRVQDQRLAAAHIVRHLRYRTGHRRRTHPRFRRPGSPRRSTGARSAARRASAFRRRTYS